MNIKHELMIGLYIIFIVSFIATIIFAKKIGLVKWLKPSFEGNDGKASSRTLTNAWYVGLNSVLSLGVFYLVYVVVLADVVNTQAVDAIWALIYLIVIYNITILLIFGIISAQNIISLVKSVRGVGGEEPIIVKTETISEVLPPTKDEKAVITKTQTNADIG